MINGIFILGNFLVNVLTITRYFIICLTIRILSKLLNILCNMHLSLEYTKTLHNSTLQLSCRNKKMMILNLHRQERAIPQHNSSQTCTCTVSKKAFAFGCIKTNGGKKSPAIKFKGIY